MPGRHKRNKNKSNKYYVKNDSPTRSIMASDSPTIERDVFTYDRPSTPPPTTSSYIPRPELTITEPTKPETEKQDKDKDKEKEKEDKDKDKDEKDKEDKDNKDDKDDKDKDDKDKEGPLGPGANPGYKNENDIIKSDKKGGDKKDGGNDGGGDKNSKMNGVDRLDGKWIPPPPKNEGEEEDSCVKCLYYSMQCCECTIV